MVNITFFIICPLCQKRGYVTNWSIVTCRNWFYWLLYYRLIITDWYFQVGCAWHKYGARHIHPAPMINWWMLLFPIACVLEYFTHQKKVFSRKLINSNWSVDVSIFCYVLLRPTPFDFNINSPNWITNPCGNVSSSALNMSNGIQPSWPLRCLSLACALIADSSLVMLIYYFPFGWWNITLALPSGNITLEPTEPMRYWSVGVYQ